ncbi:MAG TPA: hypothetical protein VFV72_12530 [Candidatus Limnocylindrales bacterium]|nr:hypothetical protein [Candidatus Limnocylindrales bacterium]
MNPTNKLGAALGMTIAVLLTVGAAIVALSANQPGTAPPNATAPAAGGGSAAPSDQAGAALRAPRTGTFQDSRIPGYDPAAPAPTADKAQSKLWFAAGSWWAVMIEPTTNTFRIHRLDWKTQEWQDTGTVVDERASTEADVLWDGKKLYVASAGSTPYKNQAGRLSRYSLDPDAGTWTLDKGFPVQITSRGVSTIVVERDTTGTLWVSYIDAGSLLINRSVGGDATWGKPFGLPLEGVDPTAARASIVAIDGRVAVIWSNKAENALFLATHRDGAPDDRWEAQRTDVEGANETDDHLNAKVGIVDGEARIYVAMKTSLDVAPNVNVNDAQILVLEIRLDGTVHKYLAGRIRDRHTRPVVVIDQTHETLYLVATAPFGGGQVYYKRTPLDRIAFSPGHGTQLIASDADPLINDVTTTKQAVSPESGIVMLAFDRSTGRYLHGVIDLGGARWDAKSRPSDNPGPAPAPTASSPASEAPASPATSPAGSAGSSAAPSAAPS